MRRWRTFGLTLLVCAATCGIGPAVAAIEYPGPIPGYPLPTDSGTTSGYVSDMDSESDNFQLALSEGEVYWGTLGYDWYQAVVSQSLVPPDAYHSQPWSLQWREGGNPSIAAWWVPQGGAGVHTIRVSCWMSGTDYDLDWAVTQRVDRLKGSNRYETAAAISRDGWISAETVVLATGLGYADALAAAGVAGCYEAPLLLTDPNGLSGATRSEVDRLGADRIIIIGGTGVVGTQVAETLRDMGLTVERLAGSDRYSTAAACADRIRSVEGEGGPCIVARGDSFADALSASPMAYWMRLPILLVNPATLPATTRETIDRNGYDEALVVGGPGAIRAVVTAGLGVPYQRIFGADRYETSREVAEFASAEGWCDFGVTGLATGENYPDALAGGAYCGSSGGSLLLTPTSRLSDSSEACLSDRSAGICALRVLGGIGAVASDVESEARTSIY